MNSSAGIELRELCSCLEGLVTQSTDPLSDYERQEGARLLLAISHMIADIATGKIAGVDLPLSTLISKFVEPLIRQSAFARHIIEKPLGYAGDFKLIQRIYDDIPEGATAVERRIDQCGLAVAAACAVRNRRPLVLQKVRSTIDESSGDRLQILSLACGPAAEVFDALEQEEVRNRVHFHLVDIDARALRFVQEKAERLGVSSCMTLHRQDINRLIVRGPSASGLAHIDFAYSIGLIDYFETRHIVKLMNFVQTLLKPGGQLLLGNFHPTNPCRDWMDHVVDWKLVHRDEAQMNAICKRTAFRRHFDSIEFEPARINLFATVRRHGD